MHITKLRIVAIYNALRKIATEYEIMLQGGGINFEDNLIAEVDKSIKDGHEVRMQRLRSAKKKPKQHLVMVKYHKRNPDVIAEVLYRASGVCERCKCEAPFVRRRDNSPYLEVRHKDRLADGGDDTIENALALCPNCHRELHFGRKETQQKHSTRENLHSVSFYAKRA